MSLMKNDKVSLHSAYERGALGYHFLSFYLNNRCYLKISLDHTFDLFQADSALNPRSLTV